jgi:AraC-like DNA-binding protein
VVSIMETKRYKKVVENEFSDMAMLQINWLWSFILILLPVIILWGAEIMRILLGGKGSSEIVTALWGFVAIIIYFISYSAFKNPELFENIPQNVMDKVGIDSNKPIDKNDSEESNKVIISKMEQNNYYLNPDLTIHDFAKEIQMSPRLISSFINGYIGVNFNEWVNNYRVDNALEIIKSDEKNLFSIEGIGNDVGFKSRSAMYAAFKKKLGNSPGHYR